jgi:group I intron endonuclease
VYKLINLNNGKSYVGSSNNLYRRLGEHCNENVNKSKLLKGQSPIAAALLKYSTENFALVILEFIDLNNEKLAKEKKVKILLSEQKFINSIKPEYNINLIAGSNLGRIYSDEVRAKMSRAKKGLPSHWLGKKKTPESVALMIKNHGMKKSIHQYNPDGTFLKSYTSIIAAEAETGISRKRIRINANQILPVLLKENIIFSFSKLNKLTDINNILTLNKNKKKLYAYNADGSLFKVFNSISPQPSPSPLMGWEGRGGRCNKY